MFSKHKFTVMKKRFLSVLKSRRERAVASFSMLTRARLNSALLALGLSLTALPAAQKSPEIDGRLSPALLKSGEETLRAFAPVSKLTRNSIVKIDLNGSTVALGAVIDPSGLVVTKA